MLLIQDEGSRYMQVASLWKVSHLRTTACMKKYCLLHLLRFRKGTTGTTSCDLCGRGLRNVIGLCVDCGYQKEATKQAMRRIRAVRAEFKGLRKI